MKILFINDYKDTIGGAEVYMYLLKDELEKRGHEVRIFSSDITKEQYILTIQSPSFKELVKRIFNISSYIRIKKFLDSYSPDIIHVHGLFNELSPSILLHLKSFSIVMTVHNDQIVSALPIQKIARKCKKLPCSGCKECVGYKGMIYEKIKRYVHSLLLAKICLFISPSLYMQKVLQTNGFKPCIQLYNPIASISFKKISSYKNILYVGRLTEEKGIKYVVNSMVDLVKQFPQARLTIIGDGPQKKEIERLIDDLDLSKYINLLPSISHEKVIPYYYKSTIVTIPSIYYDNLPTVGIEALFAGRVLVGSNIGGISELIENNANGYLVIPADEKVLSEAFITLLGDKARLNKFSRRSFLLSKKFDVVRHIDELVKIYDQLKNARN